MSLALVLGAGLALLVVAAGPMVLAPANPDSHIAALSSPAPGNWSRQNTTPTPPGRDYSAMAYDAKDGYLLLFGGYGHGGRILGDTWKYAAGKWTKLAPLHSPAATANAQMAYDAADGYVVLFGGRPASTGGSPLNDTWTFSGGNWTRLHGIAPPGRENGMMTYDAADGYVLLFGGVGRASLNDTWEFAAGVWTNLTKPKAPPATNLQAMAYDPTDGYVVLFRDAVAGNNWTFSGGNWTQIHVKGYPAPHGFGIEGPGLAFDAARGYLVLFGGFFSTSNYNFTWAYSHGVWSKLNLSVAPSHRTGFVMAYDPASLELVLFGGCLWGSYGSPNAQTWAYS
ncbi:MAG TPA: kelch repeat-containing protein [Thermoplasmata archaeon]|nr:kelch repeat-containing protein [Thermoplasmata archaeon]